MPRAKKEEIIEEKQTVSKPKVNKEGLPTDRPLTEKEYLAAKYGKK